MRREKRHSNDVSQRMIMLFIFLLGFISYCYRCRCHCVYVCPFTRLANVISFSLSANRWHSERKQRKDFVIISLLKMFKRLKCIQNRGKCNKQTISLLFHVCAICMYLMLIFFSLFSFLFQQHEWICEVNIRLCERKPRQICEYTFIHSHSKRSATVNW